MVPVVPRRHPFDAAATMTGQLLHRASDLRRLHLSRPRSARRERRPPAREDRRIVFSVVSLGKWVIASRVGIFGEDVRDGKSGRLVPPDDSAGLAIALSEAITTRPVPSCSAKRQSWADIGAMTRAIYEDVTAAP